MPLLRARVPRISGVAAGAYTLSADGGTYSYSGNNADLRFNRRLVADGGVYAYSGNNADLLFNRVLAADGGVYSYSGNNADLIYTTAGAFVLQADGGTYSYSGNNADLLFNRVLAADGGTYSYSGDDATLDYVPAGSGATPAQIWAYQIIPGVSAGAMLLQIYQRLDVAVSTRAAVSDLPGPAPSASDNATAVLLAAEVSPIRADIRKVNAYPIKGTGTDTDPWGPQ